MGTVCTQVSAVQGQDTPDLLENLMKQDPKSFRKILKKADQYEVQIIYTQIHRDASNKPSFKSFYYNTDPSRYFYPASTVKMPVAFLALERLNELGLSPELRMETDSAYSGQTAVNEDITAVSGDPSVVQYIRKIFVVSDNDAYNRLYEFLGQEYILTSLQEKGYTDTRIIHRLSIPLSEDENRHTNPVRFADSEGNVIYEQPMQFYEGSLNLRDQVLRGKGFISDNKKVMEPMDFTRKNFYPLDEMQMMLRAVMFPESVPEEQRFNLTREQLDFLYLYMSQLPGETVSPAYPVPEYYDAYSKFLMYGSEKGVTIPDHIRIFNKIGLAYGFAIDNAYIIDLENNVEFLLSAVIHTNKNMIYNDGQYEYDKTAFPFLKNLGRLIYQYELHRHRDHTPDLSRFRVAYDHE